MKVSDYIARFLEANAIRHVFGLQGGAVVHLFDSLEQTDGITAIYCHHEQAAALAATSNAKVTGAPGCAIVTTGPGCTNALTGLLAAWQDSVPVIFISGQTRIEHTSYGKPVRQVGSQEFNILDIVRPITKYSKLITSAREVESTLAEALHHAREGRMGPVWIDIPVNIQWEEIDCPAPRRVPSPEPELDAASVLDSQLEQLMAMVAASKRPVVVAGNGIRAARSDGAFVEFLRISGIPFVSTWTSSDLTGTDDPCFGGIIGVAGQRGANKILYEADLILCLGCHLAITQTSTLFNEFAPGAKKAIIDIDQGELDNLNVPFDLRICSDLRAFFRFMDNAPVKASGSSEWLARFAELKRLNSVVSTLKEKSSLGDERGINSNYFNFSLTSKLPEGCHLVIDGGGTALYTGFQSSFLKRGQRIICSSAISAMGTGLPESIGVAFGLPGCSVCCIIGDGSLMLNIQELQTIFHHRLPVKVVVYNNRGYLAIKHTQKAFLGARYSGTDAKHGLSVPAIKRVADCFQLHYLRVDSLDQVDAMIDRIVAHPGPLLVEVMVPEDQPMLFQQGYREIAKERFQPCNLSEMQPYI
jgi:acetolactate synthase-1/2/3 large subunit